ncbi:MAG: glycosyltransferase [Opitutae bacterium]|nr:glycosyltransferase [Opitutae bacterium]
MNDGTVHHISSGPITGGAGRAGFRLHQGLLSIQQHSHWMQARMPTSESLNLTNWLKPKEKKKRLSFQRNKNEKYSRRAFKGSKTCATHPESWGNSKFFLSKELPSIYNFHWMGGFLDWQTTLPEITKIRPVVWTLHDINPMQGAWHYAPLREEVTNERNRWDQYAYKIKEAALNAVDSSKLVFVAPSKWMLEQCKSSQLTRKFESFHIPYGLDTDLFSSLETSTAKKALNIDPKRKVIGFIADSISDPRKGITELTKALQAIGDTDAPLLLTVGVSDDAPAGNNRINLGSIREDRLLRIFYSACDAFICPSLQDNLPNTVLEAMACNTPVIAFNIGGLPDMVREGTSGYLVPEKDINKLAAAIKRALSSPEELKMLGAGARELATTEFNLKLQADRYTQLYEKLLSGSGREAT